MSRLTIKSSYGTYGFELPGGWHELTEKQAVWWLAHVVDHGTELSPLVIAELLEMPPEVAINIEPADWWAISRQLEFLTEPEGLTQWCPATLVGGRFVPPEADFSNLNFEQWMYADGLLALKRWPELAAALYMDKGLFFNRRRMERFDPEKCGGSKERERLFKAAGCSFAMLRRRFVKRFPHVFIEHPVEARNEKGGPVLTDWLLLMRRMLGDYFHEELKTRRLPVAAVMQRLETLAVSG